MIRHSSSVHASAMFALTILLGTFAAPARAQSDDDAQLRPAEPDFVVINLPTTLPLPVKGGNFHLTHRFNENLRNDSFSDQLQNLFGLDNGANIGLEFRFGVAKHLEAVVQRTSISRTIQFSGKYDAWHQTTSRPVSLSAIVSVEGDNNFRQDYAPALGVVVGHTIADRLALYATPFWVHNTQTGGVDNRDTGFLGLGGRLRFLETAYLVGEVTPRIGGLSIGDSEYAFGIEKRVGAHVFALTFANGASTTFRQLAHGGVPGALYLGFNLTRKFF
jgi:uncharacterized beta barrel domain-containing protein DUF5777